ncbi:hypothetical protein TeGR_g11863 [Tetraparma gracilis]|uniref:Uncharacterized protein n=1 Tax=Tetraparma gracilis TaxID=2962635 RepID=A0ABQ6M9Y5_9STRA|nr:hypothetical protein TeGR_g11863 [Tetraparma gracilis]
MIADAACYAAEYFGGTSAADVCLIAETDRADSALCSAQTGCATCTSTSKADAAPCMWFAEGFCGSECGMIGCGSTDCPSDDYDANDEAIHEFFNGGSAAAQAYSVAGGVLATALILL